MGSQSPRPVPAKNAGTRTGQPQGFNSLEGMGQPPRMTARSSAMDDTVRRPARDRKWNLLLRASAGSRHDGGISSSSGIAGRADFEDAAA